MEKQKKKKHHYSVSCHFSSYHIVSCVCVYIYIYMQWGASIVIRNHSFFPAPLSGLDLHPCVHSSKQRKLHHARNKFFTNNKAPILFTVHPWNDWNNNQEHSRTCIFFNTWKLLREWRSNWCKPCIYFKSHCWFNPLTNVCFLWEDVVTKIWFLLQGVVHLQ